MTLPDKQNEALARLVGWRESFRGKVISDWFNGDRWSDGCPDMATPEGADELLEFCAGYGFRLVARKHPETTKVPAGWHASLGRGWQIAHGSGETLSEAVCKAVLALIDGGYLTEQEPTDGTNS